MAAQFAVGSLVSYKSRNYVLSYLGNTAYGRRAKLAFTDGSKEFWCDASAISAAVSNKSAKPAVRPAPVFTGDTGPADYDPADELEQADAVGDAYEGDDNYGPPPAPRDRDDNTVPNDQPAARSDRGVHLLMAPSADVNFVGLIEIRVEAKRTLYLFTEDTLTSNHNGRLFRLHKTDGVTYAVLVGFSDQDYSCDCKDAQHRGHACKHVLSMRSLLKSRKL